MHMRSCSNTFLSLRTNLNNVSTQEAWEATKASTGLWKVFRRRGKISRRDKKGKGKGGVIFLMTSSSMMVLNTTWNTFSPHGWPSNPPLNPLNPLTQANSPSLHVTCCRTSPLVCTLYPHYLVYETLSGLPILYPTLVTPLSLLLSAPLEGPAAFTSTSHCVLL